MSAQAQTDGGDFGAVIRDLRTRLATAEGLLREWRELRDPPSHELKVRIDTHLTPPATQPASKEAP